MGYGDNIVHRSLGSPILPKRISGNVGSLKTGSICDTPRVVNLYSTK